MQDIMYYTMITVALVLFFLGVEVGASFALGVAGTALIIRVIKEVL